MTHHVTVVWHDIRAGENPLLRRKAKLVEVRERPSQDDYFLGGLLNQAMRQHGYPEEEIHAQKFVGPVEFIWPLKQVKHVKLKKVCSECGGTDVCIDAWASWSEAEQDWVLANMYEAAFCNDCEQECDIVDKEIVK